MNLTVHKEKIFGSLSPNEAGKTTTIKMITGITRPDQGENTINGKNN